MATERRKTIDRRRRRRLKLKKLRARLAKAKSQSERQNIIEKIRRVSWKAPREL